MAVVAEWVWVDGLWWQNGFVVWVDLGCGFGEVGFWWWFLLWWYGVWVWVLDLL